MLIPIRCFTCNNIIADKWDAFVIMTNLEKNKTTKENDNNLDVQYIDFKKAEKSIEGKVLDDLGLHKYCCRRMMLSNVHLISYIN